MNTIDQRRNVTLVRFSFSRCCTSADSVRDSPGRNTVSSAWFCDRRWQRDNAGRVDPSSYLISIRIHQIVDRRVAEHSEVSLTPTEFFWVILVIQTRTNNENSINGEKEDGTILHANWYTLSWVHTSGTTKMNHGTVGSVESVVLLQRHPTRSKTFVEVDSVRSFYFAMEIRYRLSLMCSS